MSIVSGKQKNKPCFPPKRAVVDIGSNSVRLVVYDGSHRAPTQICNEKALCGLGRDMGEDGSMNSEAVEMAMATLKRFRVILDEHGCPQTRVIATAAVREASDGAVFVKNVQRLGFDVDVIDGEREATLAALGVLSYNPYADGMVGDMGGGSLELVRVANGEIFNCLSLSIGPLKLIKETGGDIAKASSIVDKSLDKADWLGSEKLNTLYAVGGAWRAIARIHMGLRGYPLPILHQYELGHKDAEEICELIAHQSRKSLEEIPGIPRRRLDTLPYASMVLRKVMAQMGAERLVVSAGGVREGVLFDSLSEDERARDPLLAGAGFLAQRMSPNDSTGENAAAFTDRLFPEETPLERRVRHAACILLDIAAYFHPDYRGDQAFDIALRAPFYAISHKERLSLAMALYVRHEGRNSNYDGQRRSAINALSWDAQQRAIAIGLALRLAGALAPKAPSLLARCALERSDGMLRLKLPLSLADAIEDLPRRRLSSLASALECESEIVFT